MLGQAQPLLLAPARRLHELGYRRKWIVGDELWYERKRQPGVYQIEYIFSTSATSYLFVRRYNKTLRVNSNDERLIHLPRSEDALEWFEQQQWIDFYSLRTDADATYEFTFYFHRRAAFKTFHESNERLVAVSAMMAAYELMMEIISS
ncbi:MAG: hypothetical protein AB1489_17125 [Acidobacteriota bacterium]